MSENGKWEDQLPNKDEHMTMSIIRQVFTQTKYNFRGLSLHLPETMAWQTDSCITNIRMEGNRWVRKPRLGIDLTRDITLDVNCRGRVESKLFSHWEAASKEGQMKDIYVNQTEVLKLGDASNDSLGRELRLQSTAFGQYRP